MAKKQNPKTRTKNNLGLLIIIAVILIVIGFVLAQEAAPTPLTQTEIDYIKSNPDSLSGKSETELINTLKTNPELASYYKKDDLIRTLNADNSLLDISKGKNQQIFNQLTTEVDKSADFLNKPENAGIKESWLKGYNMNGASSDKVQIIDYDKNTGNLKVFSKDTKDFTNVNIKKIGETSGLSGTINDDGSFTPTFDGKSGPKMSKGTIDISKGSDGKFNINTKDGTAIDFSDVQEGNFKVSANGGKVDLSGFSSTQKTNIDIEASGGAQVQTSLSQVYKAQTGKLELGIANDGSITSKGTASLLDTENNKIYDFKGTLKTDKTGVRTLSQGGEITSFSKKANVLGFKADSGDINFADQFTEGTLPAGKSSIEISGIGEKTQTVNVKLTGNNKVTFKDISDSVTGINADVTRTNQDATVGAYLDLGGGKKIDISRTGVKGENAKYLARDLTVTYKDDTGKILEEYSYDYNEKRDWYTLGLTKDRTTQLTSTVYDAKNNAVTRNFNPIAVEEIPSGSVASPVAIPRVDNAISAATKQLTIRRMDDSISNKITTETAKSIGADFSGILGAIKTLAPLNRDSATKQCGKLSQNNCKEPCEWKNGACILKSS